MARELRLQRLAARQHGLASRNQLLQLGFTRRQIEGRLASRQWRLAAPAVLDVAPGALDPLRPLHAAVMASGGLASHRSAAALHRLVDAQPPRPHVLVTADHALRGIPADVRRTRSLERSERTVVDRIACTSPTRTLLDLGSVTTRRELATAVNRAFVARLSSPDRLAAVLAEPQRGRRGVAALRDVLTPYLVDKAKCESELEALLLQAIARSELPRPVWQLEVHVSGRTYRLDVAWPAPRVYIEADGVGSHTDPIRFVGDRRRENALVAAGWTPLHYTWPDITRRPRQLIRQTAKVLRAQS